MMFNLGVTIPLCSQQIVASRAILSQGTRRPNKVSIGNNIFHFRLLEIVTPAVYLENKSKQ